MSTEMQTESREFFAGLEKPLKARQGVSSLRDLVEQLHAAFAESEVDVELVNHLMLSYKSDPAEWRRYAKFDRYRYTRNLVDAGNGRFNLMVLCWGEGHGSAVHDHADAHCFMKVLQGQLHEVRYAWPVEGAPESELRETRRTTIARDAVCYMSDALGLHRVENPSHADTAVSLHLYCPPFDSCSVFNQKTGRSTKCSVTFWSKYGERRDRDLLDSQAPEDN